MDDSPNVYRRAGEPARYIGRNMYRHHLTDSEVDTLRDVAWQAIRDDAAQWETASEYQRIQIKARTATLKRILAVLGSGDAVDVNPRRAEFRRRSEAELRAMERGGREDLDAPRTPRVRDNRAGRRVRERNTALLPADASDAVMVVADEMQAHRGDGAA